MKSRSKGDIRAALTELLSDHTVLSSLTETLVELLLPEITEKLRSLGEFNAEITHEFETFKAKQNEDAVQTKRELAAKTDSIEQYQRLNSIRIFGVEEDDSEKTDELVAQVVKDELGLDIEATDIDV